MRIAWTRWASRDVASLRRCIARDGPRAAAAAAQRVLEAVERFAALPASGRCGRIPETRELVAPEPRISFPTASGTMLLKFSVSFTGCGDGRKGETPRAFGRAYDDSGPT